MCSILCAVGEVRAQSVDQTIFTAFDTETTGVTVNDGIVEIGAVKFRGDGTVLGSTNWLVNPPCDIPAYATEVHGITEDMVAEALVFADVWPQFEAFCGDSVWMAHNAMFDMRFLQVELERANLEVPAREVLDTLPLFRKWFPCAESHSLESLAAALDVSGGTHHRADADAFQIIRIFKIGMESREGLTLQHLIQHAGGLKWLDGRTRQ